MRLVLPIPESSPRRELDANRSLVVLEGTEERPTVTLTLYHPHIDPRSLIEFASDTPRADLPSGATAEMVSARVERNRVGWEMQVVHTVVARPGEPAPLEVRLTAIFRFVPYQTFVAAAMARIYEPGRFEELRPHLLELFEVGRPDWSGREPASLSQLYDD